MLVEHWSDEEPTGENGERIRQIRNYGEGPIEERKIQEKWWRNLYQGWVVLRDKKLAKVRVVQDSDYGRLILALKFEDISGGRIKATPHMSSLLLATSGYRWGNYAKVWQTDHKIPKKDMDIMSTASISSVQHYLNYDPMLAYDNLLKGVKVKVTDTSNTNNN